MFTETNYIIQPRPRQPQLLDIAFIVDVPQVTAILFFFKELCFDWLCQNVSTATNQNALWRLMNNLWQRGISVSSPTGSEWRASERFIHVYWCPTRFLYQMMFLSFNSNTTGVTFVAGTAYPSRAPGFTTVFNRVRVARLFSVWCFVDRYLSCCKYK
jgi:hypothetical protein